ncbi:MAG: 4Fe-4S dicluster domain-containing protein [bacterium]
MNRRDFLKLTGLTGTAAAAAACSEEPARLLIPFLNAPENIVPGAASWFATSCRQCPAGCGVLARNREARIVKLEGNPDHPVNRGALCARGQAGLQDLYSPDRLQSPGLRQAEAVQKPIGWAEALAAFQAEAAKAAPKIAVLSGLENGFHADLLAHWLARAGSSQILFYEPLSYDAVREGNRIALGQDLLPTYDFSSCDFLLSIAADFLETWISPVELTRQFTAARDPGGPKAGFVFAGTRLSMTGANADRWIALRSGREKDFSFALLAAVVKAAPAGAASASGAREDVKRLVAKLDPAALARRADVEPSVVQALAARIAAADRPFVLADGDADAVVAANLINLWTGSAAACMDFSRPLALSGVAKGASVRALVEKMAAGDIRMLVVHKTNPVYSLPGFAEALGKVPFVAVLDSFSTETSQMAHLTLPVHTAYESFGSFVPRKGLVDLMQPTMGPVAGSKPLEAILAPDAWPEPAQGQPQDPSAVLRRLGSALELPEGKAAPEKMLSLLARGFAEEQRRPAGPASLSPQLDGYAYRAGEEPDGLSLVAYPSLRWFDGRDANKTWMLEIPDPLSMITWEDWIEVHPERAARERLAEGDLVQIQTPGGRALIGVHITAGVHPETVAIPLGLGHTRLGRFADGIGANALALTGGALRVAGISIPKTGENRPFAHVDGSRSQHGRGIAQSIHEAGGHGHGGPEAAAGEAHEEFPVRIPIETAHDPKADIYPAHGHDKYRWGMVIDLDRCIGCSACVAACIAENNIPSVGRKRVLEGREMAWIRIERYVEEQENPGIRFLPMLCQHCDNAPCEAVCPVYAPHHDKEGLNTQIYNRCIGTRFCSQNCPYKVRRFNFFHYERTPPLNMQLNPDVTVRTKGVMEKCSFCIQRIKDAHQTARLEKRLIRDGEVVPACAQACPARAIHFGSYLDPESGISKLAGDERAYQVLAELGTKPAVIYLKKIVRNAGLETA